MATEQKIRGAPVWNARRRWSALIAAVLVGCGLGRPIDLDRVDSEVASARPRMTLEEFGARGDGVTDDSAAIARALTQAAATGRTLRIRPAMPSYRFATPRTVVLPRGSHLEVEQLPGAVIFFALSSLASGSTGLAIAAEENATTTLAAPVGFDEPALRVASAAGFALGHVVTLRSQSIMETTWHRQFEGTYRIRSLAGNVVGLDHGIRIAVRPRSEVVYTATGSKASFWVPHYYVDKDRDVEIAIDGVVRTTGFESAYKAGERGRSQGYFVHFREPPAAGARVTFRLKSRVAAERKEIVSYFPATLRWRGFDGDGLQPDEPIAGRTDAGVTYLRLTGLLGPQLVDVRTNGRSAGGSAQTGDAIVLEYTHGARVLGHTQKNARYGILVKSSFDTVIEDVVAENVRHPVTPHASSERVIARRIRATGSTSPIDSHPAWEAHFEDVRGDAVGGRPWLRAASGSLVRCHVASRPGPDATGLALGLQWVQEEGQLDSPGSYWQRRGDFSVVDSYLGFFDGRGRPADYNIQSGGRVVIRNSRIDARAVGSLGSVNANVGSASDTGCDELIVTGSTLPGSIQPRRIASVKLEDSDVGAIVHTADRSRWRSLTVLGGSLGSGFDYAIDEGGVLETPPIERRLEGVRIDARRGLVKPIAGPR